MNVTEKKKILVVDDENDSARLLAYRLGIIGYLVEVVSNGIDALELVKREHVDLVISDLMNVPISGLELLGKLKELPDTANIPCMFISSDVTRPDVIYEMKRLGASGWLPKPYVTEQLVKEVSRIFEDQVA
jgi:two-component system, OmpR family, alkaline phosphatase synthesis response regulator PhoP